MKLSILFLSLLFISCGKDGGSNNEIVNHNNDQCPKDLLGYYVDQASSEGDKTFVELNLVDNGDGTSTFSGYMDEDIIADGVSKKIQEGSAVGQEVAYCSNGTFTYSVKGRIQGKETFYVLTIKNIEDGLIEIEENWKEPSGEFGGEGMIVKKESL